MMYRYRKQIIYTIDNIINTMVLIIFIILFSYGCYTIWDSHQIYQEAETKNYENYNPNYENGDSFASLIEINDEVFGWLTIYGTNIDYPLVQSDNNQKYVNTSVWGTYSLTGSLFLDYVNARDFSDFSSVIYGHHMEKKAMFGEISEFREETYFNNHQYGNVYYNGQNYGLEIFAFIEADAYDTSIYRPNIESSHDKEQYLKMIFTRAVQIRNIEIDVTNRIVLLSTCASLSTNGRQIVVAKISEETYKNPLLTEGINQIGNFLRNNSVWIVTISIVVVTTLILWYVKHIRGVGEKKDGKENTNNQT